MSQNGYSSPVTFKQGSSFDYTGTVEILDFDEPVTGLGDWTGRCQLRTVSGGLIAEMTFAWVDAALGIMRVHCPTSTMTWPLGRAQFDFMFEGPNGERVPTNSIQMQIVAAVTHATI